MMRLACGGTWNFWFIYLDDFTERIFFHDGGPLDGT